MKRLLRGYSCCAARKVQQHLATWYASELGRALAAVEQQQLDTVLANLFGYHLVQLGSCVPSNLLSASRIRHRVVMATPDGPEPRHESGIEYFYGEAEALPIDNDTVDVVVLPHQLEFSAAPHDLLREVERVLIPEGHLVIVGFNPWSLWGLTRLLLGWKGAPPWCGRFYSRTRLSDWLSLLGFDTVISRTTFFRLPVRFGGLLQGKLPEATMRRERQ